MKERNIDKKRSVEIKKKKAEKGSTNGKSEGKERSRV